MPYCYQNPGHRREIGPFEERVVMERLIDGEINAHTRIRNSIDGVFTVLSESEFGAVLSPLTRKWKFDILRIRLLSVFYYLTLSATLLVPTLYLAGLKFFGAECASYDGFVTFALAMLIAALLEGLFRWFLIYRLWKVVPHTRMQIAPSWRLLLDYVPFFRFGWGFVLYPKLAVRLRELTNFTRYTGFAAAVTGCVCRIVLSVSLYSMIFTPFVWSFFDEGMPHYFRLIGGVIASIFAVSFVITFLSKLVMVEKMKSAAIMILRRRYAYNVPLHEVEAPFIQQVLKSCRRTECAKRWSNGIAVGSILVGTPLLLLILPCFILSIIGSCRYEASLDDLKHTASKELPSMRLALSDNEIYQDGSWDEITSKLIAPHSSLFQKSYGYLFLKAPSGSFFMANFNKTAFAYISAAQHKDKDALEHVAKQDRISRGKGLYKVFAPTMQNIVNALPKKNAD